jgi:hypothetical protein
MTVVPFKNTATTNLKVTIPTGGSASTISIVGAGGGGTGGVSYGPIYTTNATTTSAASGKIHVQGDAVFEGNITWQGRDMREWFEAVENKLGMLRPNPKLEAGWEELSQLRQQYVELEKKLLEQQRVFDILKQE